MERHRAVARTRTTLAACLVAALVGGVAAPAGASAAPEPPAPGAEPPVECVEQTADQLDAVAVAQECGEDVEVLSARTEWQTLYARPDGSLRLEMSAAAVRTRQGKAWRDVDSSLRRTRGGIAPAAPVVGMTFSDGRHGAPLATLRREGHELRLDVPFDLPRPTVDGPRLTYADVLPDVDLVVTVNEDATGFSEVLRVETPEAAADPRLARLSFPIETSSGLDVVEDAGGFAARDGAGEPVFHSATPAMWDSAEASSLPTHSFLALGGTAQRSSASPAADAADGAGEPVGDRAVAPVGGEAVSHLPATVSDDAITIDVDQDMLTDPDTVWPVYIDPPVSGSLHQWSAVRTGVTPAIRFNFADTQGVGLCDPRAPGGDDCPSRYASRLLWRFAGLEQVGAVDGGHVRSAVFSAYGTHTYDCSVRPITAHHIDDFGSGTGWPGSALWDAQHTAHVNHKQACGTGPAWVEFDVTRAARAVADANASVLALGLATDESSMAFWKRYRYDAKLSVVYNRPPAAPTGPRTSSPPSACTTGAGRPLLASTTPILRASLADPDGDSVQATFEVVDVATGGRVWGPYTTAALGSGAEHAVWVGSGLADGRAYQWRVFGRDPSGAQGPTAACEFLVDVTAPDMPVVTPVETGLPAVYRENATGGGIGKRGEFVISAGSSTDVAKFRYSVISDAKNKELVPVAGTSKLTFAPTSDGMHTLYVEAVDRAGNVSAQRVYPFVVQAPGVVALWRLDEGGGSSLFSTSHVDSGPLGNRFPMTSSPYTSRAAGLFQELGIDPTDRALKFDSGADQAATTGPVVGIESSFTVMAFVRLTSMPTRAATAVSQDGGNTSAFELGLIPGGAYSEGPCYKQQWCWGLDMRTAAGGTQKRISAAWPTEATVGDWVHLAVVRDAQAGTLSASFCKVGSVEKGTVIAHPVPRVVTVPFTSSWYAPGKFRLGHGWINSQAEPTPKAYNHWPGDVDEVRVLDTAVPREDLVRYCTRAE
ncbi:hypothetical protein GC089_16375 [Cellulomonas sp. JZ18]|uniref:LamG-like jellyroll fold domain-containing protein n=1 Tax=Cellulomonas sp. JZ18 TaxID=2654191 RepID=UPI0012D46C9D|nr:LamG-like jellyroll fold domain-containing protein [Cellulomonas sp. JZ18]QGQ20476.1 hypothetical protein GC089_16375 [Cellulomonas sp. JZ18]